MEIRVVDLLYWEEKKEFRQVSPLIVCNETGRRYTTLRREYVLGTGDPVTTVSRPVLEIQYIDKKESG